jgi:type I restriction enzyme S subunit
MSAYKPYPAYKDSGVEWLGEVPEGWVVLPMKRISRLCTERSESRSFQVGLEQIESWSGRFIEGDVDFEGGGIAFQPGDILFGKLRPYLAKVWLADRTGEAVGDFHVIRVQPPNVPEFVHRILLSRDVISLIDGSTYGAKMPRASWEFIGALPTPVPQSDEQTAIAAYLDHETAKIDALIAALRRLIDLLREKRSALISHAVTKGLNPDAPMKDSGVEWLGEVPEGWEVFPMKRLAKTQLSNVDKHMTDGERAVKLCNYVDVYKNERITPDISFMPSTASDDQIKRLSIRRGDVIITKDSETPDDIGVPSLVAENLEGVVCGYHLALLRPLDEKGVGEYLAKLLKSAYVRAQFSASAVGMTRYGLSKYDIENVLLPVPPPAEQTAIAAFLDRETAKINALIAKTEKAIELAQERRSALISAAVTGKIDVRDLGLHARV